MEPEDVDEMDCHGWHTSPSPSGLNYAISRKLFGFGVSTRMGDLKTYIRFDVVTLSSNRCLGRNSSRRVASPTFFGENTLTLWRR